MTRLPQLLILPVQCTGYSDGTLKHIILLNLLDNLFLLFCDSRALFKILTHPTQTLSTSLPSKGVFNLNFTDVKKD